MQLYEQESSTLPVNYNSYGQEQQMQKQNVKFLNSHLTFFKNMWELTKY